MTLCFVRPAFSVTQIEFWPEDFNTVQTAEQEADGFLL